MLARESLDSRGAGWMPGDQGHHGKQPLDAEKFWRPTLQDEVGGLSEQVRIIRETLGY